MTGKELEQIYNEAYKAVYWTAMAFMKNEADAEDIVQDTFVALIESYDSIKDKSKVTSWLKKTAANKCLDRIKLSKTDTMEDEFFEGVEAVPEDFLPDSIVESEDARKIVMNIINNSLSDDIRRTLILFYFDEMSIKEIAVLLGVPEGTVSRRLNFARNKIKKEVEKYEKENDTKLYGMAIPFLTKLFMKEAEQVIFKPLPASLANLSASAEASKARTNIAKSALKKGTDIMKTKILIGSGAAVVAVGATVGIILGVMNNKPEEKPAISDTTLISEVNEVTEINTESITEVTSEETTDSPITGDRWIDNSYLCIFGKNLKVGLNDGCTLQDIADTGCYFVIRSTNSSDDKYYTIDDTFVSDGMSIVIYPDEASAAVQKGAVNLRVLTPSDRESQIKDCTVHGYDCTPEVASVWEDNLIFVYPMDMTPEQLIENCGKPDSTGTNNQLPMLEYHDLIEIVNGEYVPVTGEFEEYYYTSNEFIRWIFTFDENDQLVFITMFA